VISMRFLDFSYLKFFSISVGVVHGVADTGSATARKTAFFVVPAR